MHEHEMHPAPASENAWHGEFAVAESGDLRRLHALCGIDAGRWRVCGLDIRFAYGEPAAARVFAVERDRLEAAGNDWRRLAEDHDDVVPVTEFALPATRAREILELFPDISLVAARGSTVEGEGVVLKVVDQVMPAPSRSD
jgi:hypothetical protein